MKFTGTVIHGDGYGRRLGYPTANIAISEPMSGVYAGMVELDGETYTAAVFARPNRLILEAHLLDFNDDMYGKQITIHTQNRLRDARNFDDEIELRLAIAADVATIRTQTNQRDVN